MRENVLSFIVGALVTGIIVVAVLSFISLNNRITNIEVFLQKATQRVQQPMQQVQEVKK